jgi:hypothetical protein
VIEIKYKKGRHYATLGSAIRSLCLWNAKRITIYADASVRHQHPNTSWNKLYGKGGLAYSFTKGRKSGQYVVFRYEADKDALCVTRYYRQNYKFGWSSEYTYIPIGECAEFDVRYVKGVLPIFPYYGGKEVANQNFKIIVE